MTTPVGLQFGSITGDITVTGATNFLTNYDGASLLFAGGNIRLTGSRLILPKRLFEKFSLTLFDTSDTAYLPRQNQCLCDSQNGSSSFYYLSRPFSISHLGNGGNISIETTNTVRISAPTNGEETVLIAGAYGFGHSGNISIQTGKLIHQDGSQMITDYLGDDIPLGRGKLGDIDIVARESVEVSGVSTKVFLLGFPKATGITSFSAGQQDSGNISIQTPKFVFGNGASISAGTDVSGLGGSIAISGLNGRPADSVELLGNSNFGQFLGTENNPAFSGVGNGSQIRSITSDRGNAGVVKINADRVTLQGGTRIDVSTLASGRGGSIDIQAKTVELTNGGQLISTTKGTGQAGIINAQADKILTLSGIDPTFESKRAFLSLILAISNQPTTRTALSDYLRNPNPTSQQSVLTAWQQINNNALDRQILVRAC